MVDQDGEWPEVVALCLPEALEGRAGKNCLPKVVPSLGEATQKPHRLSHVWCSLSDYFTQYEEL